MNTTIKITKNSRDFFKDFKRKYNISTYSDAIIQIYNFFERNNLDPSETLNKSFFSYLSEMKRQILEAEKERKEWMQKDSQSLRKLLVYFEKEYLINTNIGVQKLLENSQKTIKSDGENIQSDEKNLIKELEKKLYNSQKIINSQAEKLKNFEGKNFSSVTEKKLNEHKKLVEILFKKYNLEKNILKKEFVTIKMEHESFRKIFQILV